MRMLRDQASALWADLADRTRPPDLPLARRWCVLHAAACCLQVWRSNRERLAPEAAGGEWLALCLDRLAGNPDPTPEEPVVAWMLRQLHEGELFSLAPFELAR